MQYKQNIHLIHKETTSSTMTDAIELIDSQNNLPDSFLIIADEQTNGIGRNKAQWLSPRGGLWFTYGAKAEGVTHQVTLFLGYCLHKAILESYPDFYCHLKIKWPNDLIIDKRKLSGVLTQTYRGYLLIGIGINTNNEMVATDSFFEPVTLKELLGFEISNWTLLSRLLAFFLEQYPSFSGKGIGVCKSYINDNLFGYGKILEFYDDKDVVRGRCRGISDEGALLLEDNEGIISSYYSGSIISAQD